MPLPDEQFSSQLFSLLVVQVKLRVVNGKLRIGAQNWSSTALFGTVLRQCAKISWGMYLMDRGALKLTHYIQRQAICYLEVHLDTLLGWGSAVEQDWYLRNIANITAGDTSAKYRT